MTGAAPTEAHNAFAGQGAVLLDVGGDVGALVVAMPEGMDGVEVEIRPVHGRPHDHLHGSGQHHHGSGHGHDRGHSDPHVAVVRRPIQGGVLPSLVFPDVVEGDYLLALKGESESRLTVRVRGGEVAEAAWPVPG